MNAPLIFKNQQNSENVENPDHSIVVTCVIFQYPDNPDDLQDITNDIRIKVFARDDDKVEGHEEYPTGYTPDILLSG